MDTDRHRPATDCRTMNFYTDPVSDNNNSSVNPKTESSVQQQKQQNNSLQKNRSQSQFKHPFLERIALFTSHNIHDIVKLSHVDRHFQEFAQFYSVKVFRNLVLINDTQSFLDRQNKEGRNRNNNNNNAQEKSNALLSSLSSSSSLFFRPSGISLLLKNNNNNNNNNIIILDSNSHVENCLNCVIQPSSRHFIAYSHSQPNRRIGVDLPSPVPWLVDLITAAGFFGYGGRQNATTSCFGAFSQEFARLPIHRAITYGHKEVVRLMLRRSFELERIFTAPDFQEEEDHGEGRRQKIESGENSSGFRPILPDPIQTTLLCQDSSGSTILHYAVQLKQESIVAMILEYCFRLDRNISQNEKKNKKKGNSSTGAALSVTALLLGAVDDQGCNVFHAAARSASVKNMTILKLLLQSLASVDKFFASRPSKISGESNDGNDSEDHHDHPLFAKNFTKKETPLETAKSFFNDKAISILSLEMNNRRGDGKNQGATTPKSQGNENLFTEETVTTKRNYENENNNGDDDHEDFDDSSDEDVTSTLEEVSNENFHHNNESDDDIVEVKILKESKSEEGNSERVNATAKDANVEDDLMSDDDDDDEI